MSAVTVSSYDPEWPNHFTQLRDHIWPVVKGFALAIEHVGSTAVPDLAAKPIIDLDIVIRDMSFLNECVESLRTMGYEHRGNLGIVDREAFRQSHQKIKHNLYVCPQDSVALRNHLCLRDSLRADSVLREEYGALKFHLAAKFPNSIDEYVEGKTEFILKILKQSGLSSDRLDEIKKMNLAPRA